MIVSEIVRVVRSRVILGSVHKVLIKSSSIQSSRLKWIALNKSWFTMDQYAENLCVFSTN